MDLIVRSRLLLISGVLRQSLFLLMAFIPTIGCGQTTMDRSVVSADRLLESGIREKRSIENQLGATWIVSDGWAIDFDYLHQEMFHFDIDSYLQNHGPHLLPYAEVVSHFTAVKMISPRLLLALMEQQSEAVTNPEFTAAKPLGCLSEESGFLEQVRDVCTRLRLIANPDGSAPEENWPQIAISTLLPIDDLSQLASIYQRLFPGVTSARRHLDAKAGRQTIDIQFPFPIGETWQTWWGAHADDGSGSVYNSLDFADGDPDCCAPPFGTPVTVNVVASAAGTAHVGSSCYVRIKHTDGWSTTYYHMDHIVVKTGETVEANQPIGKYADNRAQAVCSGGGAGAEHVHWGLWENNSPVALQGQVISGWTVNTGNSNYDDNCNRFYLHRTGEKTCAEEDLENEGFEDNQQPTVVINAPAENSEIEIDQSGTVAVTAEVEAFDTSPLGEVTLYVNGIPQAPSLSQPPFEWIVDLSPGDYTLNVTATDIHGNIGESTVRNISVLDRIQPTVFISHPVSTQPIRWIENIRMDVYVEAQDTGTGVAEVVLQIDGEQWGEAKATGPFVWAVTLPAGSWSISANAKDGAANHATSPAVDVAVNAIQDLLIRGGCSQAAASGEGCWTLLAILFVGLAFRSRWKILGGRFHP